MLKEIKKLQRELKRQRELLKIAPTPHLRDKTKYNIKQIKKRIGEIKYGN